MQELGSLDHTDGQGVRHPGHSLGFNSEAILDSH